MLLEMRSDGLCQTRDGGELKGAGEQQLSWLLAGDSSGEAEL